MNPLLLGLDEFRGKEICLCVYSLAALLSFKKKKDSLCLPEVGDLCQREIPFLQMQT